jgi:hypothetical protein
MFCKSKTHGTIDPICNRNQSKMSVLMWAHLHTQTYLNIVLKPSLKDLQNVDNLYYIHG